MMNTFITRFIWALMLTTPLALFPLKTKAQSSLSPLVEVWKSPTCGCCNDWMKHLQANGFRVKGYDKGNNGKRSELGMPLKYGSCHTAVVDGYVIEGHVPAREIHRLLKERPKALGLSVPEMPIGSPGMDGPEYGGQFDPYQVLLIQTNGTASVYQSYSKASKTTPTQAAPAPAMKDWAQGEIRRIDPANQRLTIKHGDIPWIDMPPMTMVFYVSDTQMLLGFSVGDKIEFQVVPDGKRYRVTAIRKAGI